MKKLWFELRLKKVSLTRSLIICGLFLIVGISIISLMASFAESDINNPPAKAITADTVFVNDLVSDFDYYTGLNYTSIVNDNIPTYQNLYSHSNLVKTLVVYSGVDYFDNTKVGKVSPTETQKEYRYYKYYPKDSDGYITIELIDNPFSNRPAGTGFNGWIVDDSDPDFNTDVKIILDKKTYTRYAKVRVSGTTTSVAFKASWLRANYGTTTGDVNNFPDFGMSPIPRREVNGNVYHHTLNQYYLNTSITYYETRTVGSNQRYTGYAYNNGGYYQYRTNQRCNVGPCTYYVPITVNANTHVDLIDPATTGEVYFFNLRAGYNDRYDRIDVDFSNPANYDHLTSQRVYTSQTLGYVYDLPDGYDPTGLYYKTNSISGDSSQYYDASGTRCDVSGSNCGGTVYKLINKGDVASLPSIETDVGTLPAEIEPEDIAGIMSNVLDPSGDYYYYLVTRDMNIIDIETSGSNVSTFVENGKPLTLTDSANGGDITHYLNNTGNNTINIANDIVIENVQINSNRGLGYNVSESVSANSAISANRHNLKIGRNVTSSDNTEFTFFGVMGTSSSSTSNSEFKVIVESGIYNYFLSNGFSGTGSSIENHLKSTFIYGSDYDRIDEVNTRLRLVYCAYATNYGGLYGFNSYTPSSLMIIKSGVFGKGVNGTNYDSDYSHGVYVGSRGTAGAKDSSLRSLIVEGGDINVINGGPLVDTEYYNKNVVSLYMKGGTVRSIFGGAGRSETGGNRIIAISGGTVTNNVFGGSNSYNGDEGEGYLDGDTLVYIGGSAEIGTSDTVLFTDDDTTPVPGDVFGAGNGRSGDSFTNVGSVNNSKVIINGGTIHGSVYGGGNYGSVRSLYNTSSTDIQLLGGTIEESVYGGGNNAGGGDGGFRGTLNNSYYVEKVDYTYTTYPFSGYAPNSTYYSNTMCNGNYPGRTGSGYYWDPYTCHYARYKLPVGSLCNSNAIYYNGGGNNFTRVNNPSCTTNNDITSITVDITLNGAKVEDSIYGGSNAGGTLNGDTHINMIANTGSTKVYGGGRGAATYVAGNITVESNQTNNNALNVTEAYGGSAFGHVNTKNGKTTNVIINGGTFGQVYGGSEGDANTAPQNAGNITVTVDNGKITDVYGGNNVNGTPTGNIRVNINNGTITNVYGGGNNAAVNTSYVNIEGGTITSAYAGGNNAAINTSTTIHLKGGTITDAFGGGNNAAVAATTCYLEGSTVTNNVFGGSNNSGNNASTNVYVNSGSAKNVFGGNNLGGVVTTTNVYYAGANVTDAVYGCGYGSSTSCVRTNTYIDKTGDAADVYGGGYSAGVTEKTTVVAINGDSYDVYGGSNNSGTVAVSNVYVSGGSPNNVFGGNNQGGQTTTTNVNIGGGNIGTVYGGGNNATTNKTNVKAYGGFTSNIYGGGYSAGVTTDTNVDVYGGVVTNVFGGSNSSGNVVKSNINIEATGDSAAYDDNGNYSGASAQASGNYVVPTYTATTMSVKDVYGGNNAGGTTSTTNVYVKDGYASNVYGGSKGTNATAGTTLVNITGGNINNVYGGGDEALTTGNTEVEINDGVVGDLFGGGNNAVTNGNTNVTINDGTVTNLFGGGNGAPAVVNGYSYVIVNGGVAENNVFGGGNNAVTAGNTTVSVVKGTINGSLFGSGNNASTGIEGVTTDALSTVNILSGVIKGNVYGGANFSVVYGTTDVNVGENTVSDSALTGYTYNKEIKIGEVYTNDQGKVVRSGGTIFGGGEAKSEDDDNYTFNFISVTQGIDIEIDAADYDMEIVGSVFGSGNASSSAGTSNITIKNFGTESNVETIESIQRATNVKLISSAIQMLGAIDSTNKYSNEFTLNRIDNFYLLDNTTLYLKDGANVLKNFNSGTMVNDEFVKEAVNIGASGDIISRNVNNKLYMAPNKNLNILTEEAVEAIYAGLVNGMCFLGIYVPSDDGRTMDTGIYNTSFINNQTVDSQTAELLKYSGTYVYGQHKENHNIQVDGYWSYYLDDDGETVNIDYVDVTPKNSNFYMWMIGVQLKTYDIDLFASRYSTVGVGNLSFHDITSPNTMFYVNSFQYENLEDGITIIDKSDVKKVADTSAIANSTFGLSMSTTDTGWMTRGSTDFFTSRPAFDGTKEYQTESTESAPVLSFYLYNSKNVELNEDEEKRDLGYSSVIMTAITPDPDNPTQSVVLNIEVKVHMYLRKYEDDGYSSVISPGKKYSVFPYMAANIASTGSVSAYHNLFIDLNGVDKNGEPWTIEKLYPTGAYRAIVSDYVFPVGTTITMIDLTNNEYYYYTVTNDNVAAKSQEMQLNNEVSYRLGDFIKMDSISPGNHYSDADSNARYLDTATHSAFEEFIFTVDFADANVSEPVSSRLYLELRDATNNAIMPPVSFQADRMRFSLFTNADTQLITTGQLSSDTLYVGDSITLDLNTVYQQAVDQNNGQTIYDTAYDDYQLGSAITFYDSNGNKLDGSSLLGVVINVNGKNYYAQTDGTYRVNISNKVANVNSTIVIDTASSNIMSGQYTLKIDTFGSYDGMYSGEIKNEPLIIPLNILNNKYGLLVESSDVSITHDKNDGTDANGSRQIDFDITTSSGQSNPSLRVRLERRTYNEADDLTYEYQSVDMTEFFEDNLEVADSSRKLYYVTHDLPESVDFSLTLKEGPLKTGTYRIVFGVYDGNNYIGSVYRYLIIREMK